MSVRRMAALGTAVLVGVAPAWASMSWAESSGGPGAQPVAPMSASAVSQEVAAPAVVSLSTGGWHSCAVTSNGTVRCWGMNNSGQVGQEPFYDWNWEVRVALEVPGLTAVTQVAAGGYHTCALLASGQVRCWGANNYGQLGDGSLDESHVPVEVVDVAGAVGVTAGAWHSCALLGSGEAKCWGRNTNGQLGDGTKLTRLTAVAVTGLSGATMVSAGGFHTCALLGTGAAKCWGNNYFGALGDGTTTDRWAPVNVAGLTGATSIDAGSHHSCARLGSGAAKCWGDNVHGQLGDGTTQGRLTPVTVAGLSGATSVSAGGWHTCAVLASGGAKCWGNNWLGQLGDGTMDDRLTPVTVAGLTGAVAIAAGQKEDWSDEPPGGWHTCAVVASGAPRCWGENTYAQIGDGSAERRLLPVMVLGFTPYVPLEPARLMDTRPEGTTVDGSWVGGGPVWAGSVVEMWVPDRGGVGSNPEAVVLNVTAVQPWDAGYVTVYPCDTARPTASNLNFSAGQTVAVMVVAGTSSAPDVCFYTSKTTHLVVDVTGYYQPETAYEPLTPRRLMDTRPGTRTVDGQYAGIGVRPAWSVTEVRVGGRGGVPVNADAVVLSVTAVNTWGSGYMTVYPCGTARPTSSTLNFAPRQTIANAAILPLGTNGTVCVYTTQTTHLIMDVNGFYPDGSGGELEPLAPSRLLDTRIGLGGPLGPIVPPAGTVQLQVTGRSPSNVPADALAVVLNVTVTLPAEAGWITVYPCGSALPNASSVNYRAGQTVANAVVAKIGTSGKVCLRTSRSAQLIADITGWMPSI